MVLAVVALALVGCSENKKDDKKPSEPPAVIPQLSEITSLTEMGAKAYSTISPDASMLAWIDSSEGICIFMLDSSDTVCTPYPASWYDYPETVVWSPNSQYLTFTEIIPDESDIWIFSVVDHTYTDRTDDGVNKVVVDWTPEDSHTYLGDTIPTWSPAGDLYFFRTVRYRDSSHIGDPVNTVQRIAAADLLNDTEPELVVDFSDKTIDTFPVYAFYRGSDTLTGAAAVSPDGQKLAFLMRTDDIYAAEQGVWVVDLATGTIEHVLTQNNLRTNQPGWYPDGRGIGQAYGLAWTENGSLLVAFGATTPSFMTVYHYDFETLTPLVDFSIITDQDRFMEPDELLGGYRPTDNSLTSAAAIGDVVIAIQPGHPDGSDLPGRIVAYPVSPLADPVQLGTFTEDYGGEWVSVGQQGNVIRIEAGDLLLTFTLTP
jgi:Tol biopolymer transport system component